MARLVVCNNMVTPYTNRLFNRIADSGTDLHVLSCTKREKNRDWGGDYNKQYDHIVLRGVQFKIAASRIIHFNIGMWRLLNRLRPDLVTINGIYPTMLVAALWSVVHRTRLVFQTDGWRLTMPQSAFHRLVRPLVLGRCQAVICASEKGRRFFIEEGIDPKRIFVSHIAPAWDAPADRPDFEHRPYHVLWCGRFDKDKNPSFLVELAASLSKRVNDFRLRVIGDGPLRQKTLADLSNSGVDFDHLSYVAPETIANMFLTARILILPSTKEPWGLVCNEAMQCGTPCAVSSYTGAADELVGNGRSGLVLDLDTRQWADAIAAIVTQQTIWNEMSQAAMQATAKYDLASAANTYLAAINFASRETASLR